MRPTILILQITSTDCHGPIAPDLPVSHIFSADMPPEDCSQTNNVGKCLAIKVNEDFASQICLVRATLLLKYKNLAFPLEYTFSFLPQTSTLNFNTDLFYRLGGVLPSLPRTTNSY
ncbi:unnamed protein product [Penicillium nalgiovense]|uniref:Uncharacterized protein n=1 Tax=Penicillium nalgiovense TaxID=60175 RepID=A0A9W4MZM5_PENNA|nr:unnamed protein product [Penicillium nalgiovense]CAG8084673.1 unnamed protein product [Penicillium nalgiovense]CAG8148140.1 unnamed protein product [Penicillium nalgiovense]CAG8153972.1 unnamed protein product [Penicillium nalgiovense]CAG8166191.1 unnamed protein product [Penicillium nalgiovense]